MKNRDIQQPGIGRTPREGSLHRPARCSGHVPEILLGAVFFACLGTGAWTQVGDSAASGPRAPRVEQVAPGRYRCGKVQIHAGNRWLKFPAEVLGEDGPLEYALVTKTGARHESLLLTEVDPVEIHMAALLLGAARSAQVEPGGGGAPSAGPVDAGALQKAAEPAGKPVQLWVEMKRGEVVRRERLESWLEWRERPEGDRGKRVPETPWLYTGSYVFRGFFAAKEDGNLFALIISPAALVNMPLPQNRDDHTWFPRPEVIPPKGSSVEVEIVFAPNVPNPGQP